MKKYLILFAVFILGREICYSQQTQDVSEPFFYEVSGLVYAKQYDAKAKTFSDDYKIPAAPLKFVIMDKGVKSDKTEYVIIQFLPIEPGEDKALGRTLTNDDTYVNSEDNDELFWFNKTDLDNYLSNGTIVKRYKAPHVTPDYGASVALPFKYRPSTSGQYAKITPDLSLGGYFGAKWRLSHYDSFYVTAPVITLGLTTISINDNTVTPTTLTSTPTMQSDGLVLGITGSTGAIFTFNNFQVGFIVGWDQATGQIGQSWIYNDKPWFSMSVGFSFLGSKKTN